MPAGNRFAIVGPVPPENSSRVAGRIDLGLQPADTIEGPRAPAVFRAPTYKQIGGRPAHDRRLMGTTPSSGWYCGPFYQPLADQRGKAGTDDLRQRRSKNGSWHARSISPFIRTAGCSVPRSLRACGDVAHHRGRTGAAGRDSRRSGRAIFFSLTFLLDPSASSMGRTGAKSVEPWRAERTNRPTRNPGVSRL